MIWAGFLLGFLGSLHCIGMCGPIAISAFGNSEYSQIGSRLMYNLGRTSTYTIMGFGMGLAGMVVKVSGFQQSLSIVMGTIIIILTLAYFLGAKSGTQTLSKPLVWIKSRMSRLIKRKGLINRYTLGMINGFLPCGLVYMALGGAILGESVLETTGFMFLFGLGTIPALFGITYIAPAISKLLNINRLIPYMFVIVGIILVLRGLNLGIPFISPDLSGGGASMHENHM